MISICIPVYNTNITSLVKELSRQALSADIKHEIILSDDASDPDIQMNNLLVAELPFVTYTTNLINKGRTANRLKLSAVAKYDWLLFLDDDSIIISNDFLKLYCRHLSDTETVITGGRIYSENAPTDCSYMLHWKYGTLRESKWYEENERNVKGFQSNNFLIHKKIFTAIHFADELINYGHEDTWMGIQLEQENKKLLHIENRVLHNRLETAERFLEKSRWATDNLLLISMKVDQKILMQHVRIYRMYISLKKARMRGAISAIYSISNKMINKNLCSCAPELLWFDLYRLNYLISICR